MSEGTNELDFSALKGYKRTLFPKDWYQGEITNIKPSEKGFTLFAKVVDYKGNKEGGVDALDSEHFIYIGTKFDSETAPFMVKKNQELMAMLCKAADLDPEQRIDIEELKGKVVDIYITQTDDEMKLNKVNKIQGFRHA